MSNFNMNIFTPAGVVVEELKCDSLLIPTVKGQINVLRGHTHIVSELSSGSVKVKTNDGEKEFPVSGGLVKILGKEVTILAK